MRIAKRLDALQEQERVEGADARAQVAQPFHARADDERDGSPKTSLKIHAVIGAARAG